MKIKRAYKIELDPNKTQVRKFLQFCVAIRRVWNFYLNERKKAWEERKGKLWAMAKGESQKLTAFKQQNPWLYEVAAVCLVQCLRDQDQAMKNFFRRIKLIQQKKLSPDEAGFPRFKSAHREKDRGFRFAGKDIKIDKGKLYFPRIGLVKLKETDYLPLDIEFKNVTISSIAGRWFAAVQIEEEIESNLEEIKGRVLAVHLGIRNKMTCSNNLIIDNLLPYQRMEQRLIRLQHRKDKPPPEWKNGKDKSYLNSKNKRKLQAKIARLHYRIVNIRRNAVHNATTKIISEFREGNCHQMSFDKNVLILETWNNKRMMKDKKFAKGIADTSFYEPIRQLEYKANWAGIEIIQTELNFPSSKLCSSCGFLHENFPLSKIIFECPRCGYRANRDDNAARNVLQQGLKLLQERGASVWSTRALNLGSNACGDERSMNLLSKSRCSSMKQE